MTDKDLDEFLKAAVMLICPDDFQLFTPYLWHFVNFDFVHDGIISRSRV